MPAKRGAKPQIQLVSDRTSDTVWAAITILSLPIAAMAFSAMDFHPIAVFLLAACITFVIVVVETIVRGKIWIFQERFKDTFGHPDTPFRILIVAGGVLLILQTFLIVQIFTNPNIDHLMLNVILRKQCERYPGGLTSKICPMFMPVSVTRSYALRYSLEAEALRHIIPTATLGSCAVVPLKEWPKPEPSISVDFFAYCVPWSESGNQDLANAKAAVVQAVMDTKADGFYAARTWSQDDNGQTCNSWIQNKYLIRTLERELTQRKEALLRAYQ